jgi:hypothetical protein
MSEEKKAKELSEKAEQEPMLDGFDSDDDEQDQRLLQGTPLKFTNGYTWVTKAGEEMSTDKEFIAVDMKRVEAKWPTDKNARPHTRVLFPGEKFRDMRKLNEETPKSEWREYNGQLKGPWENQYYLYLLDSLMKRYTFVASTIGAHIAMSELRQQVRDARKVHGRATYAKVRLSDTWMKTSYSPEGRQRPHFIVTGYASKVEPPNRTQSEELEDLKKPKQDDDIEF